MLYYELLFLLLNLKLLHVNIIGKHKRLFYVGVGHLNKMLVLDEFLRTRMDRWFNNSGQYYIDAIDESLHKNSILLLERHYVWQEMES